MHSLTHFYLQRPWHKIVFWKRCWNPVLYFSWRISSNFYLMSKSLKFWKPVGLAPQKWWEDQNLVSLCLAVQCSTSLRHPTLRSSQSSTQQPSELQIFQPWVFNDFHFKGNESAMTKRLSKLYFITSTTCIFIKIWRSKFWSNESQILKLKEKCSLIFRIFKAHQYSILSP